MKKILMLLVPLLLFTACTEKSQYESYNFFAMDTFVEVRLYSEAVDKISVFKAVQTAVDDVEKSVSKTIEESPAYQLNSGNCVNYNEIFDDLLLVSLEISALTGGCFEPMSGGLVELWERCENEQRIPQKEEISNAVSDIENTTLLKNENGIWSKEGAAKLDFGAIGKGYAADKAVDILKRNNVACGMVTFISTVSVFGERDFKIAIRTPDTSGRIAGYVTLCNESLSISGDYERFYTINGERYNHIVDPYSGYSVSNGIHSVAVICDSAAQADAISTAIFVMGIEKASELYNRGMIDFEAVIITDEEIVVTPKIKNDFELVAEYKITDINDF